jgi:prophage antirepressor-like protein
MELAKIFNFADKKLRAIETPDEPWFCGKDVAEILEYKNPLKAIRDHIDSDDKISYENIILSVNESFTPEQHNKNDLKTIYINESGIYSLVLRSKKAEAKEFKRWITKIVIPSIRKNGAYVSPNISDENIEKLKADIVEKDKLLAEKDKLLADSKDELNRMHNTQRELLRYKTKLEKNETIYIVSTYHYAKQGIFKIGRTSGTMKARLSTHNTSHVSTDKVVVLREFKVNDSVFVEKNIHNKLEGLLIDGEREFFMCPFDLLESAVDMIIHNDDNENGFIAKIINIVYQLKNKIYNPDEWLKNIPDGLFPSVDNINIQEGIAEPINLDVSQWTKEQKQEYIAKCIELYNATQTQVNAAIIWKDFQQLIIAELIGVGITKNKFKATEWKEAMTNEAKNKNYIVKWIKR